MDSAKIQEIIRQQKRDARRAARLFVKSAADGNIEQFISAANALDNETCGGWSFAMRNAARLPAVTKEIQCAFLKIWIENKSISINIDKRKTLANALHVLMPCNHDGSARTIYRGTRRFERKRRLYGFSWTTKIDVAQSFAKQHSSVVAQARELGIDCLTDSDNEGIVLKTIAPPEAIMLIREEENYYDEGEVIVDPFRLSTILVDSPE